MVGGNRGPGRYGSGGIRCDDNRRGNIRAVDIEGKGHAALDGGYRIVVGFAFVAQLGAESAGRAAPIHPRPRSPIPGPNHQITILAAEAVAVACVAGAAYALLSIAIRHTMNAATQQSTLMFIITGIGTITLGPISIHRLGFDGLLATSGEQLAWLLAAGIFNLLGFIGFTKGLHLTTVLHANVLSASQVAMAAVAGILIFQESPNSWLLAGVALTVSGIFLIDRPVAEEAVDRAI